jgi:ubiquinone/menaquinone biosynthesis C-methylase UbiE
MHFDHFNLIAGVYDRAGPFHLSEPLLGLLSLSPGNLVLDVGGGTGRVAAALHDKVKRVFVADISRGMLGRAVSKGLITVCTPAEELPFLSGTFDRIIIMDALHHVMDQCQTASEVWRVLAPQGRLLIVEPDIHKPAAKLIALGEKLLLMRSHFLTGEQIASFFKTPDAKVGLTFDEFNIYLVAEKAS